MNVRSGAGFRLSVPCCLAVLVVSQAAPARSPAPTGRGDATAALAEHLNALKDVYISHDGTSRARACAVLEKSVQRLATLSAEERQRLRQSENVGRMALSSHCHASGGYLDVGSDIPNSVWSSDPTCRGGDAGIRVCRYNHETGRGLFVYRKDKDDGANYLVCSMSANSRHDILSASDAITSRCRVSSFPWDRFLPVDEGTRRDARAVLTWPDQDARGTPIEMPLPLQKQCELAFADALFCAPTLIVLPAGFRRFVDVCSLFSKRKSFGLPFIRFRDSSSEWKCARMDLKEDVRIYYGGGMSEAERMCRAGRNGKVDRKCSAPFVPRTPEDRRGL